MRCDAWRPGSIPAESYTNRRFGQVSNVRCGHHKQKATFCVAFRTRWSGAARGLVGPPRRPPPRRPAQVASAPGSDDSQIRRLSVFSPVQVERVERERSTRLLEDGGHPPPDGHPADTFARRHATRSSYDRSPRGGGPLIPPARVGRVITGTASTSPTPRCAKRSNVCAETPGTSRR